MDEGSTPTLWIMTVLAEIAEQYADTVIDAVRREYPNAPRHVMRHPDDRPTPREVHPAFYGCFDWHSAVEMHWALAALVRESPQAPFAAAARAVLDEHLTDTNLAAEARYLEENPGYERPYGWAWTLQLADDLAQWGADDAGAARWAASLRPLAEVIEAGFVAWLPRPAYPDRSGTHFNTAFALSRALPWARRRAREGGPALLDAIAAAALRWFGSDVGYHSRFEPSGADFLSPTLTEIVLMRDLLTPEAFADWYAGFLPDGRLAENLLRPAVVDDGDDGQGAHLHGLNLYRAHALRLLAGTSADGASLPEAAEAHWAAAAGAVASGNWMQEHWLAAYAVLASR
jgi:Protein of unknown function (DUF2891)